MNAMPSVACRAERSVTLTGHRHLADRPRCIQHTNVWRPRRMRRLRAGLRSCHVAPGARFEMPQARTCRFETRAGPAHRSHCQWARVSPRRIGPASESLGCMGRRRGAGLGSPVNLRSSARSRSDLPSEAPWTPGGWHNSDALPVNVKGSQPDLHAA